MGPCPQWLLCPGEGKLVMIPVLGSVRKLVFLFLGLPEEIRGREDQGHGQVAWF